MVIFLFRYQWCGQRRKPGATVFVMRKAQHKIAEKAGLFGSAR
jgi:hypothetical protein